MTECPYPTPIQDKRWTDAQGTLWHMRGHLLTARQALRLLKRTDVSVLHVCGPDARQVAAAARNALIERTEVFFAGNAPPPSDYVIAEFLSEQREVMLVVQEYC